MIKPRIGILGAGRLGKALALRLRDKNEVAVADINPKLTKQFTKQNGLTFLLEDDLYASSDLAILCVPPGEIESVVRRIDERNSGVTMILNTATGIDTPALIGRLGLRRTTLIGLKPIGQFTAIQYGVPVVFVTAHSEPADLTFLSNVFSGVGVIRRGDEKIVQVLNREATRLALEFGRAFLKAVQPIAADSEWELSALRSCAGGTILDYPPEARNPYTSALLTQMGNEPGSSVEMHLENGR